MAKDVVEDRKRGTPPTRAEGDWVKMVKFSSKILFNLGVRNEWMSINDFHELGLKCSCWVEESVRSSYPELK
jgi:hypothetical protein